jgi:hypothetical protein
MAEPVSYDPCCEYCARRILCASGRAGLMTVQEGTEIMKIDWYTKTVLTVIAACLVWMCVRSAGEPVLAQGPVRQPAQAALWSPLPAQPVVVVGWGRLNPAVAGGIEIDWSDPQRRVSEPSVPIRQSADTRFDPIRVRFESQAPLSVSVDAVRRGATWDPFRTQVEKDPPQRVPGFGGR